MATDRHSGNGVVKPNRYLMTSSGRSPIIATAGTLRDCSSARRSVIGPTLCRSSAVLRRLPGTRRKRHLHAASIDAAVASSMAAVHERLEERTDLALRLDRAVELRSLEAVAADHGENLSRVNTIATTAPSSVALSRSAEHAGGVRFPTHFDQVAGFTSPRPVSSSRRNLWGRSCRSCGRRGRGSHRRRGS